MNPLNRSEFIDPQIEHKILQTLSSIESKHDVKILHAVESGSRAWGFHSPNSDYDVRFFYVHKRDWYLSLYPERDVIELPIDETYDVSGWDLKKTLHLALKSNAVVMEWLKSPIIYKTETEFTEQLNVFCAKSFNEKSLMHHYINLGTRQIDQTWRTSKTSQVKKYFYMLRPAMALRWLKQNNGIVCAPMDIQTLMQQSDVPKAVISCTQELIKKKKTLPEKAEIDRIHDLDVFMMKEYEDAQERVRKLSETKSTNIDAANDLFRSWLY